MKSCNVKNGYAITDVKSHIKKTVSQKVMDITFKTLEKTDFSELVVAFNLAFENYFVEITVNEEQLKGKFKVDNTKLEFSVGAFHNDTLVGFIFHGIDEFNNTLVAYNGGTGVIPAYRGLKLTSRMYSHILPVLKVAGITKSVLEVITLNTNAIKIYEKVGFNIIRKVDCYKGAFKSINKYEYRLSHSALAGQKLESLWEIKPTWQSSTNSVKRHESSIITLSVMIENQAVGYLIMNTGGKVLQFSVDKTHRNKGIASCLFLKAMEQKNILMVYNVDENYKDVASFLKKGGLVHILSQYEMELYIN